MSICALCFGFYTLRAQNFIVSGFATDSFSGEKLISCSVFESGERYITTTALNGFYSLSMPAGNYTLVFAPVGYPKKRIEINLNQNIRIDAEIRPLVTETEVEISANKVERIEQTTDIGKISIPAQTLKKIPMLFGEPDVMKALQLLPGIKGGVEGTSGLYVRGGSPDQNLILLDGTPLYNVSHLYGFFSVFNADALNHVEITKGGFPARYGGRLSSVLDITMKDGNMRHYSVGVNAGLISSSIHANGPIIKNKLSFVVSARRTYIDWLTNPILRASQVIGPTSKQGYFFYDLNGKLTFRPNKKDQFNLSWYSGDDKFYNNTRPNTFLFEGVTYENESRDELGWGNRLAAFKWSRQISPKAFSTLTANYTRYKYRVYKYSRTNEATDTSVNETILSQDFNSFVRDYSVNYTVDYNINNQNYVKFGANSTWHKFQPGATAYRDRDSSSNSIDTTLGSKNVFALENFVFAEHDITLTPKWKVNYGVHYSQFILKDKFYHSLQPRVNARYLLPGNWALKGSISRMTQYIHLLTTSTIGLPTDLWVPTTKDVVPEQSWQYNAGLAKTLFNKFLFTVEGYYKSMNNVLEYKNGASFFNTSAAWYDKIEAGKGRSFGAELFIQKKVGKVTGWIAYTLSKTDRIFPTINFGKRFPFRYDSRHNFNLFVNYEVNKRHTIAATWVFATGNAFTLADTRHMAITPSGEFIEVQTFQERNKFRAADYHRLDLSWTIHANKPWGQANLNLGVYNAYARINPFYYYVGQDLYGNRVLKRRGLFSFIPFASMNFIFNSNKELNTPLSEFDKLKKKRNKGEK